MAADVKAMVDEVVDKAKNDPAFLEKLKKDPEKTIESVIGIDIPDGVVDKVMTAIKTQLTADTISGIAKNLFGKND